MVGGGVPPAVQQVYKDFDAAYKKNDLVQTEQLLTKVKLELAKLQGNQLLLEKQDAKVLELCREVYEKGAFLSIKRNDPLAFERNVKQLKIYYRDFEKSIPSKSSNEYKILGLYLLSLVCSDRISEFHTELELIQQHDSQFIQRPVLLERYLMEGNFAKINQFASEFSSQEHYPVFLEQLQQTMRRRILESLAKASSEISLDRVAKMLYMSNVSEVSGFLKKMQEEDAGDMMTDDTPNQPQWEVAGSKLRLTASSRTERIPVFDTLSNVIDYATEIERIV
ncbi:unnamed protein product [Amoebophrya sp. A120]|nr:unnamed protein product [Amoebophrya sp. A120]|eukprot:GSA120T00009749001.1